MQSTLLLSRSHNTMVIITSLSSMKCSVKLLSYFFPSVVDSRFLTCVLAQLCQYQ
ncbi:hypothetical protein Peur_072872 [Populus x canadensis]